MGHAERKARKRAGEKFSKPAKVPTPLEERSYVKAARQKQADRLTGKPVLKSVTSAHQRFGLARRNQGPARRFVENEGFDGGDAA